MATFPRPQNRLVTCPYDPAHRVLQSRLQMHITKCKVHHLDAEMETCPFNAQHRINRAEKNHHIMNCPDRDYFYRLLPKDEGDTFHGHLGVPPYSDLPQNLDSESWDNELDFNAKPIFGQIVPIGRGIVPNVAGMKPAEKKKLYQEMYSKAFEPDNGSEESSAETIVEKDVKPVRQPKSEPEAFKVSLRQEELKLVNKLGLGRGNRIAANIFGEKSSRADSSFGSPGSSHIKIGLGRGK